MHSSSCRYGCQLLLLLLLMLLATVVSTGTPISDTLGLRFAVHLLKVRMLLQHKLVFHIDAQLK
jgi:hypothetical protein